MKKLLALYFFCCLSLCQSGVQAQKDVPETVRSWITGELKKAKNQTLIKEYNSNSFFKKDSARIVGYLKGYERSLGFSTGIVYASNELLREDYPRVIEIYEDGRFEVTIPIWHPRTYFAEFKDRFIDFYVEPGQTLALIIDWPRVSTVHHGNSSGIFYQGIGGDINNDLNKLHLGIPEYKEYSSDLKLSPADFSKKYLDLWSNANNNLTQQCVDKKTHRQAQKIAQSILNNRFGSYLFDFVRVREYEKEKDSTNTNLQTAIPDSYYGFLKRIDLNDLSLMVSKEFSLFINRYEYGKPYSEAMRLGNNMSTTGLNKVKQASQLTDSLVLANYGANNNLVCKVADLRRLSFVLKYSFQGESKDSRKSFVSYFKEQQPNSFFKNEAEIALQKVKAMESGTGYSISQSKAGSILKKIVEPYKGKLLFVDFWATTCGPCVSGIKYMKDTRAKYKDNPDFNFLFITSEDESPKKDYEKFVKEQELANTVILNIDDYRYLRELFRFNGIPRYVLISAEGLVLNDNFEMYNFNYSLGKLLPKYAQMPVVKE